MLTYKIEITPDDNNTLMVTCPAFPEVSTFGDDKADAIKHASDALEEAIASRVARGENIPRPKSVGRLKDGEAIVTLPGMTTLKTELYWSMQDAGMTRADLMRRLRWKRESVDRLFRIDHASRLDQLETAFGALGRKVDISIGKAAA